jgi:hypothetical protein
MAAIVHAFNLNRSINQSIILLQLDSDAAAGVHPSINLGSPYKFECIHSWFPELE